MLFSQVGLSVYSIWKRYNVRLPNLKNCRILSMFFITYFVEHKISNIFKRFQWILKLFKNQEGKLLKSNNFSKILNKFEKMLPLKS